jgi:hypothetical protein
MYHCILCYRVLSLLLLRYSRLIRWDSLCFFFSIVMPHLAFGEGGIYIYERYEVNFWNPFTRGRTTYRIAVTRKVATNRKTSI